MKDLYVVDLLRKNPIVELYPIEIIKEDLEHYQVNSWQELNDFDWKIFTSEVEADQWLARYNDALRSLKKIETRDTSLPCMLLKRIYLAQTAMREKLCTFRHYRKNWKPGQQFVFHDQTYQITVTLTRLTEFHDNDGYGCRYDFTL